VSSDSERTASASARVATPPSPPPNLVAQFLYPQSQLLELLLQLLFQKAELSQQLLKKLLLVRRVLHMFLIFHKVIILLRAYQLMKSL
jgi:hypothetical protein